MNTRSYAADEGNPLLNCLKENWSYFLSKLQTKKNFR